MKQATHMRSKSEIMSLLTQSGIIAVVRAQRQDQILPLAEALFDGGLIAVEITLTTPNAIQAIREAKEKLGARVLIGVGTVLDVGACRAAIEAGAEFVVSPILRPELVAVAHSAERPIMLGAYTPTEAQLAHEAGADFIKIFPADGLGPNYIKALLAPLPHLRIIPTGIAKPEDVGAFLKAGCAAVGLGSLLVSREILTTNDWPELTRSASAFKTLVERARCSQTRPDFVYSLSPPKKRDRICIRSL
jgi:2-dehydro-3-deoxyphosphogluconate aldolase/(4S)-4-hydroxy-2-oxoglutarate aldolase